MNAAYGQPQGLDAGIGMPPMDPAALDDKKVVEREKPEVDKAREELVSGWIGRVHLAKKHWEDQAFKKMRWATKFAAGKQWEDADGNLAEKDDRYVANVTLRHVNQRVASVYAKNPRVRSTPRPKLHNMVWDGSKETLAAAQHSLQAAQAMMANPQAAAMGMAMGAVQAPAMDPGQAQAILKDAQEAQARRSQYAKMGRTLEIVAHYSMDEMQPRFKLSAKQLVRRVLTCKVGYVKVGYQRVMQYGPELDARIKDATQRLADIERAAADLADKEIEADSSDAEALRLSIEKLQKDKELVLREGLVFAYPKAWSIIPSMSMQQLKGFVGAEWIAEEFLFTKEQIQSIYGVDVGKDAATYNAVGLKAQPADKSGRSFCAVYEVYDLVRQECFTVCDGYCNYLKPPGDPDVWTEQFHPYYALTFNDIESDEEVYPPSDVELIYKMQLEYNRAREGLRVHRQANRPGSVASGGALTEKDKMLFAQHEDHEIMFLDGLGKQDDIAKVIQPKPVVPITPELYDVEHVYTDIQRVQGDQAANVGGTTGATATESSIAENSRVTSLQSNIDDLDDFLTDVLRAAGQILFLEMRLDTVRKIAGPGAVWPDLPPTRREVAEELVLEVRAGSSGRPNKAARATAIEKTAPFLMQVPGMKPLKLAEYLLREIDENIDPDEFFDPDLPSIVAQNAMAKPNLAPQPGGEPQGPQGAMNADNPVQSPAKAQNMYPSGDPRAGGAPLPVQ